MVAKGVMVANGRRRNFSIGHTVGCNCTGERDYMRAKKYGSIVVDPPWPYPEGWPAWRSNGKRKPLDYETLSVEQIAALPLYPLIKHEGYVFLWSTSRYLEASFSVIRSWRCVPRQTLVWCKEPIGNGCGGMFATTTEFLIVGQRIGPRSHARGKRTNGLRINTSWFRWPGGRHSEKPEDMQALI